MQHLFVASSSLLLSLLVYVTRRVAIAVLLRFVVKSAIVCKACGGGLGPTRETGKTTKLTAPGCDATDGLGWMWTVWFYASRCCSCGPPPW